MNGLAASLTIALVWAAFSNAQPETSRAAEEYRITGGEVGGYGGRLAVAQRSELKTFNPGTAVESASRGVIERMMADLIHINRQSQQTEPGLAKSWTVSRDGRRYTLHLRRGISFSDGHPFDAGDVVFTFQVYLDEKIHSPQRELLVIAGKPITVQEIDSHTVRFELAQPYAAAERLFDNIAILPRHLLQSANRDGKLAQAWRLATRRVQQLVVENQPIICLVSPNILVGAKEQLRNFRPAILNDHTLWSAEELFFRQEGQGKVQ